MIDRLKAVLDFHGAKDATIEESEEGFGVGARGPDGEYRRFTVGTAQAVEMENDTGMDWLRRQVMGYRCR